MSLGKFNLLSTNINPVLNIPVNDYKTFYKLTGYRLDDINLNKKDPGLFILLLESFYKRVIQEKYWYKKNLHGLSYNEENRKSYVKQFNFFQDDSWIDPSLLKMKFTVSKYTIHNYIIKQKRNLKFNKPIKRLKDKMFIGCMFPYLMYQDPILSGKLDHPVYNYAEYENGTIKSVPNFMIEIDNHSIDTSTKEGRLKLSKWQNKVFADLKQFSLPGTCEFTSARSYYLSYVFDMSYDKEEAIDVIKGIQFILFNETGYTCDVHSSNVKGLRRLPLSKQQSLHFSTIVAPTRWLDNYYSNSKLSEYVFAYVTKYLSKFKQFCKDNKISSQFQYWTTLNEPKKIKKIHVSEDRQINFDKMLSNPLDRNYLLNRCPLMVSIMDKDINRLRRELSIEDEHHIEEDRYKLIKKFVNKYGNRLHTLLGLHGNRIYKLTNSPLYEDKRASFILNENVKDNSHERAFDFSGEYPNGDIVDFIEYALISASNERKDIYASFQDTIDFIAELMNVQVKSAVPPKQYIKNFDFASYKEQFNQYIDESIKLMSFKNNSFKKLAEVVYNEIYFNCLNFGDISGIYNSQKMLTNEYLAEKTGLSKAMISRYIAFMTGTGIITREVTNFTNKNFDAMRNKKHQLATILKFTDYSLVDVNSNFKKIKEKQDDSLFRSISKWSADTYYQLYGDVGVIRAFGLYKAKTFKPSNVSKEMQPFIDILKSDKPITNNFVDLDQEWALKHTSTKEDDNMSINNLSITTDIQLVKDNINESENAEDISKDSVNKVSNDEESNIDFSHTDLNELNNKLKEQLKQQLIRACNSESIYEESNKITHDEVLKHDRFKNNIKLTTTDIEASNRILEVVIADEPEDRKELFRSLRPLKLLLHLSVDELTYPEQILVIKTKTCMFKNADLSQIFTNEPENKCENRTLNKTLNKSKIDQYIDWENKSSFRSTNDIDCVSALDRNITSSWYE